MTSSSPFFDIVRRVVKTRCGVVLEADKEYLLESQVEPRLVEWGFATLGDLIQRIKEEPLGDEARQVVECLIPGETYFFRDPAFYGALERTVLPELILKRSSMRRLKIWSAACSSGQEPYSVLMLLKEKFPFLFGWDLRLVASDFSRHMIRRAEEGIYNEIEIRRGLPPEYLDRYFTDLGGRWQVQEELRRVVDFREVNLGEDGFWEGDFDLLLVRNVLIYFDVETKKRIFEKLRRALGPQGTLFLGTSETALYLDNALKSTPFEDAVTGYRLKG